MKKTFRFLLAAVCLMGIASCADVPELPYPTPDPNGGGGTNTGELPFTQEFVSDFGSFVAVDVSGPDSWVIDYKTAKMTGYDGTNRNANEDWLVSCPIDLSNVDSAKMVMNYIYRYKATDDDITVWASTTFDGSSIVPSDWTQVKGNSIIEGSDWNTFVDAEFDLTPFVGGKIYVAIKYVSTLGKASTIEVKSVTIQEGQAKVDGNTPPTPNDGTLPFTQEFVSDFGSFVAVDVNGPDSWVIDYKTAKMTGYDGTNRNANEDWLVSCPVDLTDVDCAKMVMNYIYRYKSSNDDVTVWASTTFDGSSINPSDWTLVKGNSLVEGSDWSTFYNTEFDLTPFVGGKIYVAVKYVSTSGKASTIEIKSMTFEEGQASINGNEPPGPTDVTPVTIAEFNAAAVSTDVWYELVGTASNIKAGDIYGNFDLTDETGTVYVYGLLAEKGGAAKAFQDLVAKTGLANGDKIKIHGQRGDYQGKIEVKEAYLVEIVEKGGDTPPGPGPTDVTPVTIAEFNAAAVSTDVWYELIGTASNIKAGDIYGNFDLTDETGTVYVYGLLAEKGGAAKAFQDLVAKTGLANGDKIKIHGQRGDYQGKIEVKGAYLVEIVEKGGDTPPGPNPGTNLLSNGDFESWTDGLPDSWKSSTSASNATLSQSTDAHGGNYSVRISCDEKNNKRMAYKELTLKAGTYTIQFYAKGVDAEASVRPGYAIVENGTINSSSGYKYGNYTNNIPINTWTSVSHSFTLSSETVVNLLIMNPKTSNNNTAADVLIDDYELLTSDGGVVE